MKKQANTLLHRISRHPRLSTLRERFAAASRKNPLRTTLGKALLSSLLLTTALSSSTVRQENRPAPEMGDPLFDNAIGQSTLTDKTDTAQTPAPPARCYAPQGKERHPLLSFGNTSWRGFYTLANGGAYSRTLYRHAYTLKISICESSDNLAPGTYDAPTKAVYVDTNAPIEHQLAQAVIGMTRAETAHHSQRSNEAEGLLSRLNRHLVQEASATIAPYAIAAEQAVQGDEELLETLENQSADYPGIIVFSAAFKAAREAGADTQDAITLAGNNTLSFLLHDRAFVESHSDKILTMYARQLSAPAKRPDPRQDFQAADISGLAKIGRFHLATRAELLTLEHLNVVSPDVARTVDALSYLHARRNGYRTTPSTVENNPYRKVRQTTLDQTIAQSNGIYTIRQAFARASISATYTYKDRTWQAADMFKYGMQADYSLSQTPSALRPLHQSLEKRRRTSPTIIAPLLDQAIRSNVVLCYGPLEGSILGRWQRWDGAVILNHAINGQQPTNAHITTHELLHAKQSANGIDTHSQNSSLSYRQMSSLTREAASSTIPMLEALEAKINGDDSLWHFDDEQRFADHMLETYTAARQQGLPHTAALEAAGLEGYQLMFTRQWWLDTYNNTAAANLLSDINSGWTKAPSADSYSLDNIRRSGEVSDTFNFTRDLASAPTDKMIFGTNDDMRHLFAYLHLQQLQRSLGAQHESVIAQRDLMRSQKNPFLDVNFDRFSALSAANPKAKPLALMQCLVSGGTCLQTLAAPESKPQPPAPPTPSCNAA